MAKSGSDELVTKTSKSAAARRFPWRLWLWALAMTAGAGAGAYYTWQYRGQRTTAEDNLGKCNVSLTAEKAKSADLDTKKKQLDECAIKLGEEKKKADGYQALNASQAASTPTTAATGDRAEVDKRNAAADEIAKQFARTPNLAVSARRGLVVLTLPADAVFAAGTAELNDAGKIAITQVGEMLKRHSDRRFLITGHADDAKSPFKDNWDLSAQRALSVGRLLVQGGVDAHELIAGGAADSDPAREPAKNRRIEIAMLPSAGELAPLPATLGPDTAVVATTPAPTTPAPTTPAPTTPAPTPTPAAGSAAPAAPTPAK